MDGRIIAGLTLALGLAVPACYSGAGFESQLEGGEDAGDGDGDGDAGDDGEIPGECEALDPGPNLVRRLTRDEYISTVQTALGVEIEADALAVLPAELRADGFQNTSAGLVSSLAHVEGYSELAELAVGRIADVDGFIGRYTTCTTFEPACTEAFVDGLGAELLRSPVQDVERDNLVVLFAAAQTEGDGFDVGALLVTEAMLQSPRFLFRIEGEAGDGSVRAADGYEMATRLSYFIWGGPPDQALLEAAGADALRTDEEVEAQVMRMLADARIRETGDRFVSDWVHLSRLDGMVRDPDLFPDWDPAIGAAMATETRTFFEQLLFDRNQPVRELFRAQFTFVSPELATYYGLGAPDPVTGEVDVSAVSERGGILTHGSVLTIGGNESSMVSRGLFMLDTFLCGTISSPPDGVDTTPPDLEPGKTQRFYSEQRVANDACTGCHSIMEPVSWGLERFLADGRYYETDHFGNALREDGFVQVPGVEATEYDNVEELGEILANAEGVQSCFAQKNLQFALGRPLLSSDDCTVETMLDVFESSETTYSDLVLAIALSPGFRTIRTEVQ